MPNPPNIPPGTPPTPSATPVDAGQLPPPSSLLAQAYAQFVRQYNGKFVNVTRNPYGAQCVELIQAWCDMLGIERFPGNAADFEFDSHPDCGWDKNTPTNIPAVGSIVVWGRSPNLPFGHVGISGNADLLKFTSFDQNWPIGSSSHQQSHTYGGVHGWLWPMLSHVKWKPPTPVGIPVDEDAMTPQLANAIVRLAFVAGQGKEPTGAQLADRGRAAMLNPETQVQQILDSAESFEHLTLLQRLKDWWRGSHAGPGF